MLPSVRPIVYVIFAFLQEIGLPSHFAEFSKVKSDRNMHLSYTLQGLFDAHSFCGRVIDLAWSFGCIFFWISAEPFIIKMH